MPKAKQKLGTREENIEELKRLQEMYKTLPPGKKKAMQKPMQMHKSVNPGECED